MAGTARAKATRGSGALLVILSCDFLITLDFFIVNVSVPSIQEDLAASDSAVQLVIAGYALAYASGLITWGRIGDIQGRRRMFALGTASFTLASALCGLAPTAGTLVAARVLQGIAAAVMAPQMLAILGTSYSGADRVRALNLAMVGKGIAAVSGQLLGGALIQLDAGGLGWRLCFLINVPIGVAALALIPRVVPESRGRRRLQLDLTGAALVTVGLLAVVLPLLGGRQQGWPLWSWVSLIGSVLVLRSFVSRQRRLTATGGSPLVNTSLFRIRSFSVGVSIVLIFYVCMGAFFLTLALYLQDASDLDALQAGLISTAIGVGFFAVTVAVPALTRLLRGRMITLGGVVLAFGWGLLALTAALSGVSGPVGWLVPALFVCGAGMGLVMAPMTATAVSQVPPRHASAASGVLTTAIQVGSALGVAGIGVIYYGAASPTAGLSVGAICLSGVAIVIATLAQRLKGAHHGKDLRGGPAATPADHVGAGGH